MNQALSDIAQQEARKEYHGFAMGTEPNIDALISLFPNGILINGIIIGVLHSYTFVVSKWALIFL